MSSQPEQTTVIPLGPLGWVRWFWRQLTTMRVALQLLFLLAVASIPGSVFPQRTQSLIKVRQFLEENPDTGPWLDRLGMFDVYGSVWFSAIYLLLMTSLVGCIFPRVAIHWKALRSVPVPAPRNLTRLDHHTVIETQAAPEQVFAAIERAVTEGKLSKKWRSTTKPFDAQDGAAGYVSLERGYLRETGNLIFHIAVVVILISVGYGSLFGYRGQIIVREGTAFSNVLAQYDSFVPGRLFGSDQLEPFNVQLNDLKVTYEGQGAQIGTAIDFVASVKYKESPDSEAVEETVGVNRPLDIGGASMFLIGHGYAPHVRITNSEGTVVFDDSVIFLPEDGNFTSTGVIKVPDTNPQIGIQAIFAPTAQVTEERGPHSIFPDLVNPEMFMSAWVGDLGLDDGIAQNVYVLDKTNLTRIGFEEIAPGETWELPDGVGTVTLVGVRQFATFNVASDPGQNGALAGALAAILGIIAGLYVQRRRAWIRVVAGPVTRIEIAAISRYEDVDLSDVVAELAADVQGSLNQSTVGQD